MSNEEIVFQEIKSQELYSSDFWYLVGFLIGTLAVC